MTRLTPSLVERIVELERLAKAAQVYDSKWYTADELQKRRAVPEHDGDFIAACDPQTILALLADLKSAPPADTEECSLCKGKGWWEGMGAGENPCSHCNGTGRVPRDRKLRWWERPAEAGEREKIIIEWLTHGSARNLGVSAGARLMIADAIERGEHREAHMTDLTSLIGRLEKARAG